MALRDTLRNLIGIPENDYDSEYDDDMQAGNVEHLFLLTANTTRLLTSMQQPSWRLYW